MTVSLFDIMGPVTVGPSSSHTAGALRIGLICRLLLGEEITRARITFFGSFAETYRGHGTDKAVVGGLLGFSTDNEQVRDSLSIARDRGLAFEIAVSDEPVAHPNTVFIEAESHSAKLSLKGISVGGGMMRICEIEGHTVEVTCRLDTLVIFNNDQSGVVASVASTLAAAGYNISNLTLSRAKKAGSAIMVIETDLPVDDATFTFLHNISNVNRIIRIPKL